MPRSLKVFRTPIGFHDAYVAVATKKAAVEAWGSDKDIFRRGEAEEVTDPELIEKPLASPGVVIKRLRGTEAEQMAALGSAETAQHTGTKRAGTRDKSGVAKKPRPRPSRKTLKAAGDVLAEAESRHADRLKDLSAKQAQLARQRRKAEEAKAKEIERLSEKRDKAEATYQEAMRRWRAEA